MVSRLLITTALEETWRPDEPVLFLGEWCRRYARREQWQGMDAVVAAYHWDDREKMERDYAYLAELHESLLELLTRQLNRIHLVAHSPRYWRILLGPWLGYFVQIVFDRWSSIQSVLSHYGPLETVVLTVPVNHLIPNDMTEFHTLYTDETWNHHIYAEIIRRYDSIRCHLQKPGNRALAPPISRSEGLLTRLKGRMVKMYARLAGAFVGARDVFLMTTYFPWWVELAVQLRLGQFPQRWTYAASEPVLPNAAWRQWSLVADGDTEFEQCVKALLVAHMPTCYLEGYRSLLAQSQCRGWPVQPRIIFSSHAFNSDDVFKIWAAENMERGSVLLAGQHGGHYGVGRWSFNEDHEIAICDHYMSWGWRKPGCSKILPFGQIKTRRAGRPTAAANARGLLVTCTTPQYSYFMFSSMVASQWLHYFDQQCRFVEGLRETVRQSFTVRKYPIDYDWSQQQRLQDSCPDVVIDDGRSDIGDVMRTCRLYVSTYNATTYLESMAMNIPTVIFWDPCHWELRKEAVPYFEELARVGIFHATPESAASHVNQIWNNVEAWWQGEGVRRAVAQFQHNFARKVEHKTASLHALLKSVMKR